MLGGRSAVKKVFSDFFDKLTAGLRPAVFFQLGFSYVNSFLIFKKLKIKFYFMNSEKICVMLEQNENTYVLIM